MSMTTATGAFAGAATAATDPIGIVRGQVALGIAGRGAGAYPMVASSAGGGSVRGSSFDRLGGSPAVCDAVRRWLRLVAADAELAPYLVGVDLSRLAGHLALLLTAALGGPGGNIARPVAGAWRGLGLTEAHHRRVVDYLTGVLWAMGLPAAGVAAAARVFADEAGH
jgi:truncated hemoglobin YjbI